MLNNISWPGYWTTIAFSSLLYYGSIVLHFYGKSWMQKLQRRFVLSQLNTSSEAKNHPQQPGFSHVPTDATPPEDIPEYLPGVRSLVDEIQALFESPERNRYTKASLLQTLQVVTQKYEGVKGTAYQHSVSNLIVFLAEQNSSIHLSAEEVGRVWL